MRHHGRPAEPGWRFRLHEVVFEADTLTCSAEDLVVLKAFAARGRDRVDVEGIIVRQDGAIDWAYIDEHLEPLAALKEAPEILTELTTRRAEFER